MQRGAGAILGIRYLVRITSRTPSTTTNKLEAGPAAKGRDNESQMRRSHQCFFGLVATWDVPGTCPTQKLPLLFNLIQMGPRKTNLVFRRSPDRGGVLTSSKKTENNMLFCIRTSMPAEYWYVPRVIYKQKLHPTRSLLIILTWGGVWCRFLVLFLSTPA